MTHKKNQKKNKVTNKSLKRNILLALKETPSVPLNYKQLAKRIGVEASSQKKLIPVLREMVMENKIKEEKRGKYIAINADKKINGVVTIIPAGYAFVKTTELNQDVYISRSNINGALTDDHVEIVLLQRKAKGKLCGRIVHVIKRARSIFSGTIVYHKDAAYLCNDNPKSPAKIYLNNPKTVQPGDKVAVRIIKWKGNSGFPEGEIVELLGVPGSIEAEINEILINADFPLKFTHAAKKLAESIPVTISQTDLKDRKDFRNIPTFTIDPDDAKDFDDAISFRKSDTGYEIGVHIADVSHYIHENDLLDQEAEKRGTSVYLADRTLPMLPEKISNLICSLRPNEDKLCFSVVFIIDKNYAILNTWIGKTIINSNKRFTYNEAQHNLSQHKGQFANELQTLNTIAANIRKKRISSGGIEFESSEVKIKFDQSGFPSEFIMSKQQEANKIIEEFMLLANKAVAEFVGKQNKKAKPFIYRIHDKPHDDKIESFKRFIHGFGYKFSTKKSEPVSVSLNKLMKHISGKREEFIISQLAIRTMAKALYSTENIRHYGLGFSHYTHFTSPIRRYPDLIVHRMLAKYLANGTVKNAHALDSLCKHCSERENLATEAERDSIKFFQALYLENHLNETFSGVVSGISEWGLFIELEDNKCEGMVRFRDIKNDYYSPNEDRHFVVGFNKKNKIKLGDSVKVIVKSVDVLQKKITFKLIEPLNV